MKETQETQNRSNDIDPSEGPIRESVDSDDQDLEFEVTEAHAQDSELVGGYVPAGEEKLGIESNSDLMQPGSNAAEVSRPELGPSPIGESEPILPEAQEPDESDSLGDYDFPKEPEQTRNGESSLEKLSDEKVAEITRRMNSENTETSSYLSDEEKMNLINGIDAASAEENQQEKPIGFDNSPIVPPKRQNKEADVATNAEIQLTGEKPKMSKRLRGVAHFAKGYIKISGEQELHEGDELVINGREYVLRHKKVSNKLLFGVVASLVAIMMFVLGTLFSSDADTGAGSIVGMVLDDYGQPFLSGAEVRFPEQGKSYTTNSQGFFKTDRLGAGSYKIEYWIDDQLLSTDYATVVDDRVTTLSLHPEETVEEPAANHVQAVQPSRSQAPPAQPARAEATPPTAKPKSSAPAPKSSSKSNTKSSSSSASTWSKLTLAANVEGARLSIDGNVLGAGNLTYSKIKPGSHKYLIEKDGYQPATGTVKLSGGETSRLEVTLTKATQQQKASTYAGQDYYYSGESALEAGDYQTAVSDFTHAIDAKPSNGSAYLKRAEANLGIPDPVSAHDDFVRAAEIFGMAGDNGAALAAFGRALDVDPKSIAAYLGRGNLYLNQGEDIAAIADFDMVVRLDKRNLDGYLGLGQARYRQGAYSKAIKHFKDARSIDSENPEIYKSLMLSYFSDGEFKDVKKSYEKFLKCATENEVNAFRNDSRYTAMLRVIDN